MRNSELEKELKRIWDSIHRIEDFLTSKKADNPKVTQVDKLKLNKNIPQENKSVKELKKKEVSSESNGKSNVDILDETKRTCQDNC